MKQLRSTLRALPTLLRIGFAEVVAYRAEFVVWIFAYSMPIIMLSLWTSVAREGKLGGFGEREFQAYFLATLVVRLASGSWVVWELNTDVRQGTLATRLLRPIHPLIAYLTENLAAIPLRALTLIPIVGLFVLAYGPVRITHDPVQLMIVPISVAGAFLLTFLPMACIGTLSLFWESSIALFDVWLGLYTVLSGYVMPLSLFPGFMGELVRYLPFRQSLAFPVENALGMISRAQTLRDLALQWSWVLLFAVLSHKLWRVGLRRFAAYGG